ncbi:MAG TPA: sugar phosphate isomerase/epimerase family protein [Terriglobia bacterium]|nr:sugar phosphate isomerase/epimerase family protein [Terriglobia bacterium]
MGKSWTRRSFLSATLAAWPSVAYLNAAKASRAMGWKLGIITDEITENLEQALDFISHYDLGFCELRDMWQKNIMNLSQAQLDRAKSLVEKHHLNVTDIGSPIFKYNLPQMPAKKDEKRDTFRADFTEQDSDHLLKQSFKLARFFGTRKVRIFSYWRVQEPEKAYPYVRDRLAKAAKAAGENDIVLILENEHECNIGTGKELGRILRDINSPYLRGNWDPGNAAMLHEIPYPDGYNHVKGMFPHMHIKDVKKGPGGKLLWAPVGGGFIDWKGQFEALRRDKYEGDMALETHYRRPDGNKVESTRESLMGLFKVIKETA